MAATPATRYDTDHGGAHHRRRHPHRRASGAGPPASPSRGGSTHMTADLAQPRSRRRGIRMLIGAACATVVAISGVTLAGTAHAEADRTLTSNTTGTHNGFYFSFWKDSGDASMTLRENGRYSSRWSNSTNNWVGGK